MGFPNRAISSSVNVRLRIASNRFEDISFAVFLNFQSILNPFTVYIQLHQYVCNLCKKVMILHGRIIPTLYGIGCFLIVETLVFLFSSDFAPQLSTLQIYSLLSSMALDTPNWKESTQVKMLKSP